MKIRAGESLGENFHLDSERKGKKDFLVIGSLNAEGKSSVVGAQDDTFSRVLI